MNQDTLTAAREILALAEKATPNYQAIGNTLYIDTDWFAMVGRISDVAFIAYARTAAPLLAREVVRLVEQVAALEKENSELRAFVKRQNDSQCKGW